MVEQSYVAYINPVARSYKLQDDATLVSTFNVSEILKTIHSYLMCGTQG